MWSQTSSTRNTSLFISELLRRIKHGRGTSSIVSDFLISKKDCGVFQLLFWWKSFSSCVMLKSMYKFSDLSCQDLNDPIDVRNSTTLDVINIPLFLNNMSLWPMNVLRRPFLTVQYLRIFKKYCSSRMRISYLRRDLCRSQTKYN